MMHKLLVTLLVLLLGIIFFFLYQGLYLDHKMLPSVLLNKEVPTFSLPILGDKEHYFTNKHLLGKSTLLIVWSSWCIECQSENRTLMKLHGINKLRMIGIDYKDSVQSAKRWLNRYGNPYENIVDDQQGNLGFELGVYGVPESFFIDQQGYIKKKWIGPLTMSIIKQEMLPLLKGA